MVLKTRHLERKYDKTLMVSMQLLDAERIRNKCLKHLFLEFENHDLQLQLKHTSNELAQSTKAEHDAQLQLRDLRKEVDRLQGIVRTSARTSDSLQKEIESLKSAAIQSEKLLAQKTGPPKDLPDTQSEFRHIETKDLSIQTLFSERHSLQQQVHTLEGQVENEKRESERARTREVHQEEQILDLTTRLEEARKHLSEETKARTRQERDSQKQGLEWEAQRSALEQRLESLHKQLRLTKDELQEVRKNLQHNGNTKTNDKDDLAPRSRPNQFQSSPTRGNADMVIATPGAVQGHDRVQGVKTLPGDKSAFSITPFLLRGSAPRDPSSSSGDDSDELHAGNGRGFDGVKFIEPNASRQAKPGRGRVENPNKQNSNPRRFKSKKVSTAMDSDTSLENSDNRDQSKNHGVLGNQSTGLTVSKPKKRKLGSQLDGELAEDLDVIKKPGRKLAGRNASPDDILQPNSPSGKRLARLPRNRVFGGFTNFSPLKRDRK
ncbi:hypothetical protein PHISCL_04026 [Aspergillus sclerotialis]|uniref:Uncharacterized protein n=1 Tax=Aspergillus sclerotialis TaxID=2070753 RepID=A0A3A2ZM43_9EURO|nr:hypothetical protein PHISCL_04026 [Aspergillus sclerotialis]